LREEGGRCLGSVARELEVDHELERALKAAPRREVVGPAPEGLRKGEAALAKSRVDRDDLGIVSSACLVEEPEERGEALFGLVAQLGGASMDEELVERLREGRSAGVPVGGMARHGAMTDLPEIARHIRG